MVITVSCITTVDRFQQLMSPAMSALGTPQAPRLPHFLTDTPLPHGRPWGTSNAENTNYYDFTPHTGVTRYFDWTVSKVPCAPDGVANTCLLVNDQFPGPTIEANWGDWIEVKVHNNISDEGTAMHWVVLCPLTTHCDQLLTMDTVSDEARPSVFGGIELYSTNIRQARNPSERHTMDGWRPRV